MSRKTSSVRLKPDTTEEEEQPRRAQRSLSRNFSAFSACSAVAFPRENRAIDVLNQRGEILQACRKPTMSNVRERCAREAVAAIVNAFRTHALVALAEGNHNNEQGHAFRLSLIRDPGSPPR
jgi:hypothetical protein